MKSAPLHILIDLDGTLTDPRQGFIRSVRHALNRLRIEPPSNAELEACIGPPLHHTFARFCADKQQTATAIELYRERYASTGLFENRLYDGIPACLARLANSASSLHVATSKPTIYSQRIIDRVGLDAHIDQVYGSNLDGSLADKTDLLQQLIDREHIDPARAVMIGDRKFDVLGASNHRMRSIGVLWGFGSADELQAAGADRLCDNPAQLHDLVFSD